MKHKIRGRIIRIATDTQRARKGGYLFRGIELKVIPENRRAFIMFPETVRDDNRRDLYEFPLLCWEGAEILTWGLRLNNELSDGTLLYITETEAFAVLEPKRLVSVVEAVDAARCVRSLDARYRVAPEEPLWMAKGRMVHHLFGHLMHCKAKGLHPVFERAFETAKAAIMEALPGSTKSVDEKALAKEARQHFEKVKSWLDNNAHTNSGMLVECDRMSSQFGLKGRADAIFLDGDAKTILELKAARIATDDHAHQLYAYTLLFSEEERAPMPEGRLLYSATGKAEGLRASYRSLVIEGRNRAVALKYAYTQENTDRLAALLSQECPHRDRKCFTRAACFGIEGLLGKKDDSPDHAKTQYYERWFRLLSLEAWESDSAFAKILDTSTLEERCREGGTLRVREVRSLEQQTSSSMSEASDEIQNATRSRVEPFDHKELVNGVGKTLLSVTIQDTQLGDVNQGDEVILHHGDPTKPDSLRGRVVRADSTSLAVSAQVPLPGSLKSSDRDPDFYTFLSGTEWFLDRVPFSKGTDVARHALYRFLDKGDPAVLDAVILTVADRVQSPSAYPTGVTRGPDLAFSEGLFEELNKEQECAVKAALEAMPYHLIHGPPGTGKTRVLARLIRLCLDRRERVLVVGPTNVALDRLMTSIARLGVRDFIRVGPRMTVSSDLIDFEDRSVSGSTLLSDISSSGMDLNLFRRKVKETRLIAATAYQCASHPLFIRQRFDRVVVDESGQLDEPSTLAALALGSRFVLGGDHLQLPPVVLERSLFERLLECSPPERISRLLVQYRMSREIQEIPSRLFYDGTLMPADQAAHRRLNIDKRVARDQALSMILDPELPVVFADVEGPNSGKARPEEARLAFEVLRNLVTAGVPATEIGVITPYRAQQAMIRRLLDESPTSESLASISVDTVDRFQGGEKEVIILSLARSDGVTSFLADRKRLNVSLSRARSKLILLGHGRSLNEHPLFKALLQGLTRVSISPLSLIASDI